MALLPVKGGIEALIDDDLYPFLSKWKWCLNASGYISGSLGMLHHLCFGPRPQPAHLIDICHLNENKLDCRRENLAGLPHWLNQVLNPKRRGRIKGVSSLPSGSWKAEITINGEKVYLGSAPSRRSAIKIKLNAVDRARRLHLEGATPEEIRSALALAT